jgi:hypothetical protein
VADPADHPIQPLPSAQLLLYRFGPDAEFEGRLVGALERIESGGGLRVLDAIFVRRDPDTGELAAFAAHGDGAGRIVAPLLDFRLDATKRRRATERAPAPAIAPTRCTSSPPRSGRGRRWPRRWSSTSGRSRSRTRWRGPAARS